MWWEILEVCEDSVESAVNAAKNVLINVLKE